MADAFGVTVAFGGGDPMRALDAYLAAGEAALGDLEGPFALVVWDRRTGTLLAARDAMGVHPLFSARLRGGFVLASSLDAVLQHGEVRRRADRLVLATHLLDVAPPAGATYLEGVRRVPAGHLLRARGGEVDLRRWWDPASAPEPPQEPARALRRFEALLERAVERCIADRPAAVYLSGGRDSATIAVMATAVSARCGLPPPLALSLTFPGLPSDEAATQARVAGRLGLPHVAVPYGEAVGADGLLSAALRLSQASPASPTSLLQPGYDHLASVARAHGRPVVLTGDGGDEWLLPSPYHVADALHTLDVPALYAAWRAWWRYAPTNSRGAVLRVLLWDWGTKQLLRSAVADAARRPRLARLRAGRARRVVASLPAWLAPEPDVRDALVQRVLDQVPRERGRLDAQYRRALLSDPDLSVTLEHASADRSRLDVELRMPLLDRDVVAFLYRTPARHLFGRGEPKWLASELLAARLGPVGVGWPSTVVGDSIWERALRDEGAAAWDALGGVPGLESLGVVDSKVLRAAIDRARRGEPVERSAAIVDALLLEGWLRARL